MDGKKLGVALCANPEAHEPHDFPLDDPEWPGGPEWHCPGMVELAELEADDEPELPGISASKFRDDLRTTFLVIGLPTLMFGVLLHIWGGWLLAFFAGMLLVTVGLDVAMRVRRINAIRRWMIERDELTMHEEDE